MMDENKTLDMESLVTRLCKVPQFRNLSDDSIRDIVFSGQLIHFRAGTILFHEGDSECGMHVLLKGHVHLYKSGIQGEETIIASIKPVIMFNEVPILDGGPNPVSAIATQDSATWCIDHKRFQFLMQKYPELGIGLLKVLAARNRLMLNRYEDLLSRPIFARVSKVIVTLGESGTSPINRRKYNNQRMAALAATTPEAVSRSIKTLKDERIIDASRSAITVLKPDQLFRKALIEPIGSSHSQKEPPAHK